MFLSSLADALRVCCLVPGPKDGVLRVTGRDRLDLLHRLSTNDLLRLGPGEACSTTFLTDKGRIVDLAHVMVGTESILLITSGSEPSRLKSWIEKYTIMEDVAIDEISSRLSAYYFVGAQAVSKVSSALQMSLSSGVTAVTPSPAGEYSVTVVPWPGRDFVLGVGVAGAHSFPPLLTEVGPSVGPAQAEAVRILLGLPGPGTELVPAFNPYDVGLTHTISTRKGCYIGQEVIARLETYQKAQRRLCGVIFEEVGGDFAPPGEILVQGQEVGVVTSVAQIDGRSFGLAVMRKEISPPARLTVTDREGRSRSLSVLPLPFPSAAFTSVEGA